MPEINSVKRSHNHYDILGLSRYSGRRELSKDDVKFAYRRALLTHHPDKASAASHEVAQQLSKEPLYSIDQIVNAYEVLSDPVKRAQYDAFLEKNSLLAGDRSPAKVAHIGVDMFDLEDLEYNVQEESWSRGCRCGDNHGYTITESDLEQESQAGEIYVGCRGCSLFIKVLFQVEDV